LSAVDEATGSVKTESRVRYYFCDADQQSGAVLQGMWIFLVQEVMFFGGLFTAYLLYRTWFPHAFALASHHLDVRLGTLNTAVLLVSSFTMATAVRCTQVRRRIGTVVSLLLTASLGVAFLCIKGIEYGVKFKEHLVPGSSFTWHLGGNVHHIEMFYNLYFAMTGLHALHMIVGVGLVLALVPRAMRGVFNDGYNDPVAVVGLYWHFVDIIWIFLFPLLYLLGRH
jgi:cytochrome c oxidase subunit 3